MRWLRVEVFLVVEVGVLVNVEVHLVDAVIVEVIGVVL